MSKKLSIPVYAGLGQRLRAARRARRLTQRELAARAGISATAVCLLERIGAGRSRTIYLAELAGALGVSVEWLGLGLGPPEPLG